MEDRIRKLEANIRKLKTLYDQYFIGVEKRSPDKLAADVAREVRFLSTNRIGNTALRFRAQQAVARYNTYLQYWQRNMKDLEEGRAYRRRISQEGADGAEAQNGVVVISATFPDRSRMESLLGALAREYRRAGNGKVPEMSKLRNAVDRQTRAISDKYGCDTVAYRVVTEDGKVKLKASPVVRPGS